MSKADGYYHKYNFLKFRIMEAAIWYCKGAFTVRDIEAATGIDRKKVGDALLRWRRRKCGFVKIVGRQKSSHGLLIQYKLTEKGIEMYYKLLMRIKRGCNLNMLHPPKHLETYGKYEAKMPKEIEEHFLLPEQLAPYIGITKQGSIEFGIDKISALTTAGIVPEKDTL